MAGIGLTDFMTGLRSGVNSASAGMNSSLQQIAEAARAKKALAAKQAYDERQKLAGWDHNAVVVDAANANAEKVAKAGYAQDDKTAIRGNDWNVEAADNIQFGLNSRLDKEQFEISQRQREAAEAASKAASIKAGAELEEGNQNRALQSRIAGTPWIPGADEATGAGYTTPGHYQTAPRPARGGGNSGGPGSGRRSLFDMRKSAIADYLRPRHTELEKQLQLNTADSMARVNAIRQEAATHADNEVSRYADADEAVGGTVFNQEEVKVWRSMHPRSSPHATTTPDMSQDDADEAELEALKKGRPSPAPAAPAPPAPSSPIGRMGPLANFRARRAARGAQEPDRWMADIEAEFPIEVDEPPPPVTGTSFGEPDILPSDGQDIGEPAPPAGPVVGQRWTPPTKPSFADITAQQPASNYQPGPPRARPPAPPPPATSAPSWSDLSRQAGPEQEDAAENAAEGGVEEPFGAAPPAGERELGYMGEGDGEGEDAPVRLGYGLYPQPAPSAAGQTRDEATTARWAGEDQDAAIARDQSAAVENAQYQMNAASEQSPAAPRPPPSFRSRAQQMAHAVKQAGAHPLDTARRLFSSPAPPPAANFDNIPGIVKLKPGSSMEAKAPLLANGMIEVADGIFIPSPSYRPRR